MVHPPDQTLARLASILGIDPARLAEAGRTRAAELLAEGKATTERPDRDRDVAAAIAGRDGLARAMLAHFTSAELRGELIRRGDL